MSESLDGARSIGRVRTVVKQSAIAWVSDYRPLDRDVLVRLNNPWQARPGELLDYELKRSAGDKSRWHGVDVIFGRQPGLEELLALDGGEGLSPSGLHAVLAEIARDPRRLAAVFSPQTSRALKRQLLDEHGFPLPAALVEACLGHPALRDAARRRVAAGPLDAGRLQHLLSERGKPVQEAALWRRVREECPELLRRPLELPAEGLGERVRAWLREFNEPWLLLQLPPAAAESAAGALLRAGLFSRTPADADLAQALEQRFAQREIAILRAAFIESCTGSGPGADDPLWEDLSRRESWTRMLEGLVDHPQVAAPARQRLLGSARVEPHLALRLLLEGSAGPERPRLLAALAELPFAEAAGLPAETLLAWFDESLALADSASARRLQTWLGQFAAVAERIEDWLGDETRRPAALAALCAAPAFGRGQIQRLLGLAMDEEQRRALVAAVSARSPERWQERYLLSEAETDLWRAAGAPV
jgi:hypothetical protein